MARVGEGWTLLEDRLVTRARAGSSLLLEDMFARFCKTHIFLGECVDVVDPSQSSCDLRGCEDASDGTGGLP